MQGDRGTVEDSGRESAPVRLIKAVRSGGQNGESFTGEQVHEVCRLCES